MKIYHCDKQTLIQSVRRGKSLNHSLGKYNRFSCEKQQLYHEESSKFRDVALADLCAVGMKIILSMFISYTGDRKVTWMFLITGNFRGC